jgi:hypothetical protein
MFWSKLKNWLLARNFRLLREILRYDIKWKSFQSIEKTL